MTERNVTRAAARVGRTQPAMSGTLARLREIM
ncbi:LysR family transcriptional regulator [Martelella sp. AMO21009]